MPRDKAAEIARIRQREAEYWDKRFELLEEAKEKPLKEFLENMEAQYDRSINVIEAKVSLFISRLSDEEGIPLDRARELLTDPELRTFKMGLKEYIAAAEANAEHFDKDVAKELERASLRYRVTRLEALKYQIKAEVARLTADAQRDAYNLLAETYREEYARTAFEVFKGCGVVMTDFTVPEWDAIDTVLREPWAADGMSFMQKHGGYSRQLMSDLEDTLAKAVITGMGYNEAAREIEHSMKGLDGADGALYKARRLISTESAFFCCQAQKQCFKRLGVKRYRFRAELNVNVCENCAELDGKIFEYGVERVGVNYPPMHPFCRCIAVPYIDNTEVPGYAKGFRSGRDENGKSVLFSEDMTFEEWFKEVGEELQEREDERRRKAAARRRKAKS